MTQDRRAQLRVNVVNFKVRYKSATVDEFSERHRLEVSPQGIFVQTANPLAIGTMVKFDVRLASGQAVLRGAGCVVWNRDVAQSSRSRPPGMGVRFIEVDGPSQMLIDKMSSGGADAGLAYEEPLQEEPLEDATIVQPARSPVRQAASTPPVRRASMRRPTLMGIGASPTSMFPEMDARAEMPSQPDPTLIEEMSELLDTELSEEETFTETLSQQFFSRPVGVASAPAGARSSTENGVDRSADTLQEPLPPDLRPPSVVRMLERSRGRTGRGMRAWVALTLLTSVVLVPARHSPRVSRSETAATPLATVRAAEGETTPEAKAEPAASSSAAPETAPPATAIPAPGPKIVSTDGHTSPAPSTRVARPAARGTAPVLATPKRRWRPVSTGADDNPY